MKMKKSKVKRDKKKKSDAWFYRHFPFENEIDLPLLSAQSLPYRLCPVDVYCDNFNGSLSVTLSSDNLPLVPSWCHERKKEIAGRLKLI